MKSIGRIIRDARLAKGLSQRELAARIRIHRNTVLNYEGEVTAPVGLYLQALEKALDINLTEDSNEENHQ